jgi:LysM repeat protein
MDKISSEISINGFIPSTTTPTEKRALSEVISTPKRSGGNYGSLAKSPLQPTFYICHQVESDDTMQRLALKYSINIQEIKRVNKLWSDAELSLLENVYIPVNSSQLSTLQSLYPTLNVVQNPSPIPTRARKSSANTITNDETVSFIRTSGSTASITTNYPSYQDYFSKIDQQIRTSKNSLQSYILPNQQSKPHSNGTSNGNHSNEMSSSQNSRLTFWNNSRHKGIHHLSDNSVFVNIATQNSREKHVSAALERIQREKDNFDEL